eukprot:TRINITY_DN2344_c0_g1_i4.p1 TRINITY_DN2344_c0_g1~~TRINITY_DN2344_c0_g1_i4.p1  ORF type:complete len:496 (+),score=133.33 TRINITY_DN2344_c0_g1_i4:78-1565(+)
MADGWGQEVWANDDKVRHIAGKEYPVWRTFDECTGQWKFPKGLMSFLYEAGFKAPTPIQAYTWPALCDGSDVIGVAKTGSGKTLGFLLPGYIRVKREEKDAGNLKHSGPLMAILAPTRELCLQIYQESEKFGAPAMISTACCYGGAPKGNQAQNLWRGPHCVVATPGRMIDFLSDGTLKLGWCNYLVLDEADRMLDMGFLPQINNILPYLRQDASSPRQTAFFTATWPQEVQSIASSLTRDPTHIQVGSSGHSSNSDIRQHVHKVWTPSDKWLWMEQTLFPLLRTSDGSALIFANTKRTCQEMFWKLKSAGAPVAQLHGDMSQGEREESLWHFRAGKVKVMVATDVAQRGLDIKNVQVVVNYDPPNNMEDYIHRIGRTGRAGEKGDAYTFLGPNDGQIARQIQMQMQKAGQQATKDLEDLANGANSYGEGKGGKGGSGIGNATGNWNSFTGFNGGGGGGGGGKGSYQGSYKGGDWGDSWGGKGGGYNNWWDKGGW